MHEGVGCPFWGSGSSLARFRGTTHPTSSCEGGGLGANVVEQVGRGSGKVEVDARWLELYARRVGEAADELGKARDELRSGPTLTTAFGDLGRSLRSAESYRRAAEVLNQQLDRACGTLGSAAEGLAAVADSYGGQDEEVVAMLRAVERQQG